MANKLNLNPIVLDTFDADVTIKKKGVGALTIKKIVLYSAADGDRFSLEDEDGNPIVIMSNKGNADTESENFGGYPQTFTNGVVFDTGDSLNSGLGSGDIVLIYLK